MTDEQYESLRQHILDVKVEVEAMKLQLRQILKNQEQAAVRDVPPADYLNAVEAIDIPDDLRRAFKL
jgi:hypothetical protein